MKAMFIKANDGVINGSADGRTGVLDSAAKQRRKVCQSQVRLEDIYIYYM